MIRKVTLALAAPLALAAVLSTPPTAQAADRFGVVGIENATPTTIRLQHRWGNGQWSMDVLNPGARKWYWSEYAQANQNRSPPFHVRFDSDLRAGTFYEKYDLKKNRAPDHDWNYAHKYVFRYDGGANFIELYEAR